MIILNVPNLSVFFERATFYKRRPIVVGTICLVANANARNSQQVKTYSKNKNISFTFFYDWINTKIKKYYTIIKTFTQGAKQRLRFAPLLAHVNITLFAKQYTQVICKTLNTLECFRHRSISRGHFLAIPKHCKSNYHTLWQ